MNAKSGIKKAIKPIALPNQVSLIDPAVIINKPKINNKK
jgi:hypothetical protein